MRPLLLGLLLAGCGPVLLGEEQALGPAGSDGNDDEVTVPGSGAAGSVASSDDGGVSSGAADAGMPPAVVIGIRPLDCGRCFELTAEASGGVPPYELAWDDGLREPLRRVCVDAALVLSVVAVDAAGARSAAASVRLDGGGDAGCAEPAQPTDAGPPPMLCLENASFEGTPAVNLGVDQAFDAPPWSACTNPVLPNTPDIGNESVAATMSVPAPTDGTTFLALGEGEQVSQALCSEISGAAELHLQLDLSRVDLSEIAPQTEQVFLQIWSGLSVDCSQRELLWASPALSIGWQTFCVTLRPRSYTTQITLRAGADLTSPSPAYLLVDNLQPVESCP
jgi:hypothetical protein